VSGSTSDQELKSEYQGSELAVNSTKVMEPFAFLRKVGRESDFWLAFRDGRRGPCNLESVDGPLEYGDHDAVRSPDAGAQKEAVSKLEKFNAEPMIAVYESRMTFPQKPPRAWDGNDLACTSTIIKMMGLGSVELPAHGFGNRLL